MKSGKGNGFVVDNKDLIEMMNKVVNTAKQQKGKPYTWGGKGPNNFDCSGFTWYVLNSVGFKGGYASSTSQASSYGIPVDPKDLAPGDLVFFGSPVHHAGIYIGGGSFIHARGSQAPSSWKSVEITPLATYYKPVSRARRIFFTEEENSQGKGKNHRLDVLPSSGSGASSSSGEAKQIDVHNFGIPSVGDMPTLAGCSDQVNEVLYFGGLASGVDPALLKVIAKKESTCGVNKRISRNSNGTYDYGLMQINSGGFKALGVTSEADKKKMQEDDVMNVWASTQVLKDKKVAIQQTYKGRTIAGRKVKDDPFTLFWFYNSANSAGLGYAGEPTSEYLKITKVKKSKIGTTYEPSKIDYLMGSIVYATGSEVKIDDIITEGKMPLEEYTKKVDGIKSGNLTIGGSSTSSNYKDYLGVTDESSGVGAEGETSTIDTAIQYKIYRITIKVIRIINWIIGALAITGTVVLGIMWSCWIMARSGVPFTDKLSLVLTKGKFNVYGEDSFKDLLSISLVVSLTLGLVISGVLVNFLSTLIGKILL